MLAVRLRSCKGTQTFQGYSRTNYCNIDVALTPVMLLADMYNSIHKRFLLLCVVINAHTQYNGITTTTVVVEDIVLLDLKCSFFH